MYLGEVIVVEGVGGELVFYRSERLVGDIEIVSIILIRLRYRDERVVTAGLWIKSIRYRSGKLPPRYLPKLGVSKSIESILLYLWEELAECVVSLENQASAVG